MAITRAQQFRQMLEDGGMLVQPSTTGRRPGYRRSKYDESGGGIKGGPSRPSSNFPTDDDQDADAITMAQAMEDQDFKGRRVVDGKTDLRTRPDKLADLKEKLRKFKDRRNKVNIPGIGLSKGLQGIAQAFSDFGAKFNRPFFERVIAAERIPGLDLSTIQNMSEDEIEDAYKSYMADRLAGKTDAMGNLKAGFMRDATGKIISTGNDGREDLIIPIIPKPIEQEEVEQIARNFGGLPARITGSLFDFTGMADGGRIGAMGGGMMDLDSARQMMFLGGIAKSISKGLKGVTRAAKKVFKSPVGKAALLGLGAYYAPGIGIKATGGFSNLTQPGGFLSTLLTKGGDKALNLDNLSGLKIAGLLTAAPFLFSSDEEEEDKPTNMGPTLTMEELLAIRANPFKYLTPRIAGSQFAAEGGRIGYQKGSKEPVAKKVMPLLDMGGKEMDLRDNGGFVPIGRMEKADDVPARLSKNEFVFTADAVRNAGDGDVDKGAEVMYNMMKNLEAGGSVSEESQGLDGARKMFQTAQRLGEVV